MADNEPNRAGDTSQRCGNSPALRFSKDFIPPSPSIRVLDEDGLVTKLGSLGFVDADTEQARYLLGRIGYAHVKGYLREFTDGRVPSLMRVHQAMTLDRRFQAVLLEYIGLFELQFRAQYSQELARVGGAFAHRDEENFKSPEHFREFVGDYQRELNRQLNAGNRHVMALMGRYGELPIWDAVEVMSFGTLSKMYKNTRSKAVRFVVADSFGVRHEMLESWMQSIAYARNRCAHFGRLLGTTLSAPPKRLGGISLSNQHPFYLVLVLEKLLNTDVGFSDDTSLMYSLSLLLDMANLIARTPRNIADLYVPPNWRSMMTARNVAGTSVEMLASGQPNSSVTVIAKRPEQQ